MTVPVTETKAGPLSPHPEKNKAHAPPSATAAETRLIVIVSILLNVDTNGLAVHPPAGGS
jgi:hypothetical protein